MKKRIVLILLISILILGFFLRVFGLGNESFWADESATVCTTQQKASQIIEDIYFTSEHAPEYSEGGGTPPFYFVIANYWTRLVGLSEAKLRFLSAIFGVISIYVIFLVGKTIFGYQTGLVSALILSVSYLAINYSQEARKYSLCILLTLLTVYFLINALKKERLLDWIGYILSGALLIYTHYFGLFVLLFEYLYLLIFWKTYRKSLKSVIVSGMGIFILYLPWIPALIRQIILGPGGTWETSKNIIYNLTKILIQFNSWVSPDIETRIALRSTYHSIGNFANLNFFNVTLTSWFTIISVLLLTILMGTLFLISIFVKNKKFCTDNFKDKKYIFLLLWFLVPIFVPIVISIILPGSPIFGFVQYTLFALPAYYLIVSKGILKFKKYWILLILIIILSILPLLSFYTNFEKQQWREAAQYLHENRKTDELVVVSKANHVWPLSYYYDDMENVIGVKNVDELIWNIKNEDSVWLVYSSKMFGDPQGTIKGYLDANYKLNKEMEFTGVQVFNYSLYWN